MKVVILGDTHFGCGYSMGKIDSQKKLNSRLIDYSNTFDYVIDYIVENNVKHLVLAGDIFEYRRPQASELSLFSEKIHRLEECKVHTHIIVGNHDLIREQRATTIDVLKKLKLPRTFVYPDISTFVCEENNQFLNLIFFPYRTRYMLDCRTNEEAVKRLWDRLSYNLKNISNNGPKIVVGHCMLQGTRLGDMILEGNGGEVVLPLKMFNETDGVVMGHIHPYSIIQRDPIIVYVGSMERKDFGDSDVKKYFLVLDLEDKLSFNFKLLPTRDLFDIVVDQSNASSPEEAENGTIKYLKNYDKNVIDSIVRVTIYVNEKVSTEFNRDKVRDFVKNNLMAHNCMNVHIQITSKRQLRKETITERKSALEAFLEYLDLVEDVGLREKMKEVGVRIIQERGGL